MKFTIRMMVIFSIAKILSACAGFPISDKGANEKEIIYKLENGKLLNVYNMTELWFSYEGVGYLDRRDSKYGEFGGQMEICSNEDYYCLGGGINIAIPKNIEKQKAWQFNNRSCQLTKTAPEKQLTTIICKFKNYSTTEFIYSPSRGIISYTRSSDPKDEYKLIGEKGLFAETGYSTKPSITEDNNDIAVSVAEPLELEITTDNLTQEEIVAEHGEPDRKVLLDDKASLCKRRWYYDGQANLGFGMVDVAMYVDFDENGVICKKKN